MSRRIIDAHVHLDPRQGTAAAAAASLAAAMTAASVERAVVLHLEMQPWSVRDFIEALQPYRERMLGFVNLHPHALDAASVLEQSLAVGYRGLKLHPRLQRYALGDGRTHELVRLAGSLGVPVIVDAFPDGDWLMQGFQPLEFASLARACPETRIVLAHMGGHHVLDMLMLAKRLPNVYFDLSFSLLYYRSSSVTADIVYAIRSLRYQRVFYGSDHPDRPLDDALGQTVELLEEAGLTADGLDRILYMNAREFFAWNGN